ncbi:MAG: hypothetical protein NVSMB48_20130 [Marmoricola sp.]
MRGHEPLVVPWTGDPLVELPELLIVGEGVVCVVCVVGDVCVVPVWLLGVARGVVDVEVGAGVVGVVWLVWLVWLVLVPVDAVAVWVETAIQPARPRVAAPAEATAALLH